MKKLLIFMLIFMLAFASVISVTSCTTETASTEVLTTEAPPTTNQPPQTSETQPQTSDTEATKNTEPPTVVTSEPINEEYTVTFEVDGGMVIQPKKIKHGGLLTANDVYTEKTGYDKYIWC